MSQLSSRARVELARAALSRIGLESPELRPYQDEPAQMPSGTVGKDGYLRLEFADQGDRSVMAFMDRRVPFLVQRALYWDEAMPQMPCIFIITTTGCVLQGDRMALEIEVGKNAQAHVTTQSATKVHMMNANYASQLQDIVVEEGGYLEYMPDPLIPHRTSRFLSKTRISVAETGSLLYAEVVLPGRKYHHEDELFGFDLYSSTIEATRRESGEKLFVEKFIIDPRETDLSRTGIMNGYEVFGNVILMTTKEKTMQVREAVEAGLDKEADLAYGASLLPGECGLIFKVLGMTSESVRGKIREFWQIARKAVTGHDLPQAFLTLAAVSAASVRMPASTSWFLLFCRKAILQPGKHPEGNMNAVAKDSPNPWNALASQNPVIHFIDVCLRGAGQVMFQNNPLTGLFFLVGIFWGAYSAHMISVGIGAVIGTIVGTLTAYALRAPKENINIGLHGYNGILVGCALPTFFAPTPLLWGYIVAGSIFSTVLMMAVSSMLRTWKVSAMTGPFVITTWFLMLAAYNFGNIQIISLPHPAISVQPAASDLFALNMEQFWRAAFAGVSQVFLINNVITGILFLIGLAVSSIWAAVFAFIGSIIAICTAVILGGGSTAIIAGLFQFSAVLTAIGLGTTFYNPNWRVICYTFLGTVFTVVAQGALNVLLNVYGIPTLTFPFVVAAWIFLLPNIDLLPKTHQN